MAATTNWALPYPAGTDPPCAATQIQSLATATDTALTAAHNSPWAIFNVRTLAQAQANVALVSMDLNSQSAHNLFSMTNPQNIVTTDLGAIYRAQVRMRWTVTGGATLDKGFMQCWVETPAATIATDWTIRVLGAAQLDVNATMLFKFTGPTTTVRVRNNCGVAASVVNTSQVFLTRVSK